MATTRVRLKGLDKDKEVFGLGEVGPDEIDSTFRPSGSSVRIVRGRTRSRVFTPQVASALLMYLSITIVCIACVFILLVFYLDRRSWTGGAPHKEEEAEDRRRREKVAEAVKGMRERRRKDWGKGEGG
ncbi:hypothetical protein HOP50_13g70920 [Chloropicon primus]|uniref:Uncharacterized protein n=1 Tax=Chloropicon primus TaxID=1764295 RepID=A0A5B8MYT2_9CHLO|nr:hypothetical protein A3770_13p70720 [Chloropicon primus]UPR03762.1 hypothetical protein HOP50_13g70920 [Chloropicon primus]|mmetsp:Transcript_11871/g.32796  ORF Transcript_11871/g.32796 Transcript_11871/m.32796 type:complete len:128 (+) Transcript_11871:160-543(+)|eukprot:QDZ24554.1 hypothetical protein A3770_13p70720 [Chloropicon primus]